MLAILLLLATFVADLFKSRRRLEAENLFLRHQLNVALRRAPLRLRLHGSDRALLVWITRIWPNLLDLSQVVKPETILRWHRAGFKAFWRWKSRHRAGRPKIDREVRDLRASTASCSSLASKSRSQPRLQIHDRTPRTAIADVADIPAQPCRRNRCDRPLPGSDRYVECLFAFLVVSHGRRQLLWFAVTKHATAEWLAQQIVEAFPWDTAPHYLIRDNDGVYGQAFTNRVRRMGIRDRPIAARSPWQNPMLNT